MKTGFVYDEIYLSHETPSFHPESPKRLIAILDALDKEKSLKEKLISLKPRKAEKKDLITTHTENYIDQIFQSRAGYLDSDTFMSKGSLDAALYAVGALLTAVDNVKDRNIDGAFCAVRPPGHHAEKDMAMGFCIFNNVAVGANYALSQGYKRVFIVDFDVHHGNGTQHIFYDRDDVFYFSSHQYPHYPGTGRYTEKGKGKGEGFTYNVPLAAYAGDSEFLEIYTRTLPELVKNFDPDIIFVSAGYDIRDMDPLSSLRVTGKGIEIIVRGILSCKKGIPHIFSLEGGYNLSALAESVIITLKTMLAA